MVPLHCACSLLMFAGFAPFVAADAGSECGGDEGQVCDPSENFLCGIPSPPNFCVCPPEFHTEDRGRTCVKGANPDKACTSNEGCRTGLECRNSACKCPEDTPHWNRATLKCQATAALAGDYCKFTRTGDCGRPKRRVCEDGQCVCQLPMPDWNNANTRCECSAASCPQPRTCNDDKECVCADATQFWSSVRNMCEPTCSGTTCRPPRKCDDNVCKCPTDKPHHDETTGTCGPTPTGCTPADCPPPRGCQTDGQCKCPAETPNWDGAACSATAPSCTNENCPPPRTCRANACVCQTATDVWNSAKMMCEPPVSTERCEKCIPPRICKNRECKCPPLTPTWTPDANQTEASRGVGKCGCTNEACPTPLMCKDDVCKCGKDDESYVEGKCVNGMQIFGGPCETAAGCVLERKLTCINKVCGCAEGLVWAEAVCKPKMDLDQCNPDEIPNACLNKSLSQNLDCDAVERVCRCPAETEFSVPTKTCKLKPGEFCYSNKTFLHDLCVSEHCDLDKSSDTFKSCDCPHVGGIRHIWSSEPDEGCVVDYSGFKCSADTDCHPAKFNSERTGLSCDSGLCVCKDERTFIQGYCVKTTQSHDEKCDPSGKEPTCRTDAKLSCQDVGAAGKPEFKCACLPRLVPRKNNPNGNIVVTLTWDAEAKTCVLKANGETCHRFHECKSGYCHPRRQKCQDHVKMGIADRFKIHKIVLIFNLTLILSHFVQNNIS